MKRTYRLLRNGPSGTSSRVIRVPPIIATRIPDTQEFTVHLSASGALIYKPVKK